MRRARSETFGRAFRTAIRNPGRSLLTMLGLAIGVGAFIAMVTFGTGARRSVLEQFEILGTRLISVRTNVGQREAGAQAAKPLTELELTALRRDATSMQHLVPTVTQVRPVSASGATHTTKVTGTTPDFAVVHRWSTQTGGMFDATDMEQRAKVCLLGATVSRELFGPADAVGRSVTVGRNLPCRIIGVLSTKGQSTSGRDIDDLVLVPVTTFQTFLGMPGGYDEIQIQVRPGASLQTAIDEARPIVRRVHGLAEDDPDDFRIRSPVQSARSADYVARILTGLLVGIASVSLLVGGIGVMNIQFVSVAERTKEIGIRSAIGASPKQIMMQFLAEAMVLSFIGAAAGVLLGWLSSNMIAKGMGWSYGISPWTILVSAAFGIFVGVAFGYLPARRAARLEPIEALRRE